MTRQPSATNQRPRFVPAIIGAVALCTLLSGAASAQSQDPAASAHSSDPVASMPAAGAPTSGPSLPHDVPDLEARFPDAIDGTALFKLSMGEPTLSGMDAGSLGDFSTLADTLGVAVTDFEIAVANDPTALVPFNLLAFRAAGVPGTALVSTYADLVPKSETDTTTEQLQVGDVDVVHIAMPHNQVPNLWFWAEDDVLVGIQAADDATFQRLYALLTAGADASAVPVPSPATSPGASPATSPPTGPAASPAASPAA